MEACNWEGKAMLEGKVLLEELKYEHETKPLTNA